MIVNDSNYYLSFLNKLVGSQNNNCYSINKNLSKLIILFYLQKLWRILKLLSLNLMIDSEVLIMRIFLVKVTLKIGQGKYLLSILFWKLILGLMKLKFKQRKNNRKLLWKRIVAE